jgi:hypothetical protein
LPCAHTQQSTWQRSRRVSIQRAAAADLPATAPAGPTTSLEEKQRQQQQHRQYVIQETRNFLEQDLQKLFDTGNITEPRYAKNIVFEDPITQYSNLEGYLFMIRALRTAFNIKFDLHSMEVAGPEELVARCGSSPRGTAGVAAPTGLQQGPHHPCLSAAATRVRQGTIGAVSCVTHVAHSSHLPLIPWWHQE